MQNKFIIIPAFLLLFQPKDYSIINSNSQKEPEKDLSRIEIQFKDTLNKKVPKGFIILINNKEDFIIEFAKNEKYRKYIIDNKGLVYISKNTINKYFSEGLDSVSAICFYKNKSHKFRFDIRNNATIVFLNQ